MPDIQLFKHLTCPNDYGGCGKTDGWQVSLGHQRIIMDCVCGYRLSLPFDQTNLSKSAFRTMPLFYDQNSTVKD